uniref:Calmodulin n=1 Tax=Craspedostauros australis TaxID=1486917 RepID=A0A7R9ZIJ0_9STRA|mmetsp:Transcript_10979/g.30338  ORF Transcript_10979/g.30338 Transcript_10979/m.30338 type:complete len:196 (+) Transcript_10979:134-721(+)|eukprot:CAMPEP_0198121324 /NCGR_PEP_ID=MMETSP1442-20131203/31797_1 /TAXON_ID= /ORGANISM="Craspedostauros australis, Strain CCMP3328" /LENGTH=195 /DNA_ID=CAMNT_0043780107 /DNA_START=88 /DNA_END=675 /DNA_ORIENTATION=-
MFRIPAFCVRTLLLMAFLFVASSRAQFGVPPSAKVDHAQNDLVQDLMQDPELAEAMEMFAQMSPQEMKELMGEMVGILGDDPSTIQAMQEVMEDLSQMQPGDFEAALQEMIDDRYVSQALDETLMELAGADEEMLQTILAKADLVLESVIQSGQLTDEEILQFKADPDLWKAELKAIWSDLQEQAKQASALGDEL